MIKLFHQCPACGGQLAITECRCTKCQLQLRGEFQLGSFSRLSDDQLTFIRVFLSARGNLTEVERVLGISYPTIRNKLEEINTALNQLEKAESDTRDAASAASASDDERKAILQKVAAGQLTAAEAVQKLQALKGEKP